MNPYVLWSWIGSLVLSFIAAVVLSPPPPRGRYLLEWLGDFFVRWGLTSLAMWTFFVILIVFLPDWLSGVNAVLIPPLMGYMQTSTFWGLTAATLTNLALFGGSLIFRAAVEAEEPVPIAVVVYQQQPQPVPQVAQHQAVEHVERKA